MTIEGETAVIKQATNANENVIANASANVNLNGNGNGNGNANENLKKNRIQVSNTKKPLFFYVNLAKVTYASLSLHIYITVCLS